MIKAIETQQEVKGNNTMKKWKKEITINAPIDYVWSFFYGDIEKKKIIFPKVTSEEMLHQTDDVIGSVVLQTYQIGSVTQQYEITIKDFTDEVHTKALVEHFLLNDRFYITTEYKLKSIDESSTTFYYTSINKPKNILLSVFQLFGKADVVNNFMNRVKTAIENTYQAEGKD